MEVLSGHFSRCEGYHVLIQRGFDWGSPPMKRTRFVEQSILFYACGNEVRDDDVSPLWPEVWVSHLVK
jgi:hypothetical protein